MSAAKHTPGPWSTGAGNYDAIKAGKGARAFTIAEVTGPHQLNPISSEETFANARLIAAAPDLLAAAIEARAWCCGEKAEKSIGGFCSACTALSAAIAKARAA